jgi:ubiquinone biosynthesis protein UbiJ
MSQGPVPSDEETATPMADEPENLVLELLRRLDGKADKVDRLVNDLARENVTRAEVEAVHEDLTQLHQELDALTVRLEMIGGRQKHR